MTTARELMTVDPVSIRDTDTLRRRRAHHA